MKITIAPDSLKESLTCVEAARAIARGVRAAAPSARTVLVPMADGGEGTVEAFLQATAGRRVTVQAADPLGRPVASSFALSADGARAFIEMAAASGLALLDPGERNPMLTSTAGTGQLIRATLDRGAKEIFVGIGGSATVDGGCAMAAELGARFLDGDGKPVARCCGARLKDIRRVDLTGLDPRLSGTSITVVCDVRNPLTGPQGAARVYGPQKGADPQMVDELEQGLASLAQVIAEQLGKEVASLPGAGAAGGLGAGLVAFLAAKLTPGVEAVIDAVGLEEKMRGSDLVITAEGRLDGQSAFGKTPAGVASLAKRLGIPAVALAGSIGSGYEKIYDTGICAVFCILDRPMPIEDAIAEADALLERAAESVTRLFIIGKP